jgi:hypothetical protein
MKPIAGIFGPVPPGASPLNGFVILAIALLGLLYIPVQMRRMHFSKEWPKLALEVAVLLFLVVVGITMISKNQGQ